MNTKKAWWCAQKRLDYILELCYCTILGSIVNIIGGTYVALLIYNNLRLAAELYFLGSMNLASSDTFVDAQIFQPLEFE